MEIALLLALILLNGAFSMSEIAVVSSRKARLKRLADEGSAGADRALVLHSDPSRFLSTVQVGITLIGILSGAIGESALADPFSAWLATFPTLEPYARPMALTVVVIGLTYVSVVVGELLPKRLGLLAPEGVASWVAGPMDVVSRVARPLVWLLTTSSGLLLRLMGIARSEEPPVTDEEIEVLMEQGAEAGVFHESEQEIVSNVLRLDEQRIVSIMTPRSDVYFVDLDDDEEEVRRRIVDSPYERIPVCRDGLDHVVGILRTSDLLKPALEGRPLELESMLTPPLYVPESVTTTRLLENFRAARMQFALIVDEYGGVEGLVSVSDVLTAIVGEIPTGDLPEDREIIEREDGSWLVDGGITIERLRDDLEIDEEMPGEEENAYNTLGGFVMHMLGRVPAEAERVEWSGWRFEVMDMDKNRVDKVLVQRIPGPEPVTVIVTRS